MFSRHSRCFRFIIGYVPLSFNSDTATSFSKIDPSPWQIISNAGRLPSSSWSLCSSGHWSHRSHGSRQIMFYQLQVGVWPLSLHGQQFIHSGVRPWHCHILPQWQAHLSPKCSPRSRASGAPLQSAHPRHPTRLWLYRSGRVRVSCLLPIVCSFC